MDFKEYPYMIQFSSKGAGFSFFFGSLRYNITIDFNSNTVIFRKTNDKAKETYETIYPIEPEELLKLSQICAIKEFKQFISGIDSFSFSMPLRSKGYRDGWRSQCSFFLQNGECISTTLGFIYEENPAEKILAWIRKNFPDESAISCHF